MCEWKSMFVSRDGLGLVQLIFPGFSLCVIGLFLTDPQDSYTVPSQWDDRWKGWRKLQQRRYESVWDAEKQQRQQEWEGTAEGQRGGFFFKKSHPSKNSLDDTRLRAVKWVFVCFCVCGDRGRVTERLCPTVSKVNLLHFIYKSAESPVLQINNSGPKWVSEWVIMVFLIHSPVAIVFFCLFVFYFLHKSAQKPLWSYWLKPVLLWVCPLPHVSKHECVLPIRMSSLTTCSQQSKWAGWHAELLSLLTACVCEWHDKGFLRWHSKYRLHTL